MYANEPEMAKDWEKKNEGLQKDRNELALHIIDLNNMLGQAKLSKNPKAKKYIKLIQKDLKDARKELSKLKEERDYKAEYKKFQSSTKAKKYRAELNKYNRQKGTYGNGDGKDASHKGGKIVGFEKESVNRGRAEKSRLKKEANMPDFNPMIDKALDEVIEEYTMARTPVIDKIAKLAKANKYGDVDGTKMNGKTAKQIIAIYNHPKMKRFKNAMKNYTADQFSDLTIKLPKVLGIKENDMNEGNPLELGKLKDAIKMFQKKIKKQGRVTNARDEEHLKRLMKIYNDMGGRKIKENNELFEWLQEACWKGYEKKGMKTMFGKRYPNCVKKTKKEGVDEGQKRRASDILRKFDMAYIKFSQEVRDVMKLMDKSTGNKTDSRIINKAYGKHLIPFDDIMQSWARGQQNNPKIDESVKEGTTQKFNSAKIDRAIKIAKSMGGNMTGAVKKIEKIEKNLSKNGRVEYALQQANEGLGDRISKISKKYAKGQKKSKKALKNKKGPYQEGVNEAVEMGKGVKKLMKIADEGYGKVGGTTVDSMSANLFKQLYDKANDDIKQKLNKKNEKQLVMIIGRMWKKFGKNVTIGSSV